MSVALMSRLLNISARKHVVISLHAPKKLLKRNFGVTKREKEKKNLIMIQETQECLQSMITTITVPRGVLRLQCDWFLGAVGEIVVL